MKNVIVIFIIAFCFAACGGGTADTSDAKASPNTTTTEQKQGKEYTSKYICPMHCKGSGAAAEGQCPVCGMDYVANEKWVDPHAGHNH